MCIRDRPSGTGLDKFKELYPKRFFDVGIAEQHAVTFSAGLAIEGLKPFAAIYSTFLQRAYDQIIHDIAIQNLPVRFAIDRAGLVGADGPTHAGSFDLTYLSILPNFVVMAASNEVELARMVKTAADYSLGPISFRYPRGNVFGLDMPTEIESLEIGKGKIIRQGEKIALLNLGTRIEEVKNASDTLEAMGLSCTIADARFAKPLDKDLIRDLSKNHELMITIEEGSSGGFGAHVLMFLADEGILDNGFKIRNLYLPDTFIQHGDVNDMYAQAGLNSENIVKLAMKALDINKNKFKIIKS